MVHPKVHLQAFTCPVLRESTQRNESNHNSSLTWIFKSVRNSKSFIIFWCFLSWWHLTSACSWSSCLLLCWCFMLMDQTHTKKKNYKFSNLHIVGTHYEANLVVLIFLFQGATTNTQSQTKAWSCMSNHMIILLHSMTATCKHWSHSIQNNKYWHSSQIGIFRILLEPL